MKFGIRIVRSLYRSGSLTTVARELARYKLDLVSEQDIRWEKAGTVGAGDYTFFLWKQKQISSIGNSTFVHNRIASAVKRA
jgi:hypothetical protein